MRDVTLAQVIWTISILGGFGIAMAAGLVPFEWRVLGIVLLCLFFELMDSSLGMGYGTSLTPILLFMGYEPLDLVPTILVSEFLSGFGASFFHAEAGNVSFSPRSLHLRAALILSACSLVGVVIGVQFAFSVPRDVLRLAIGIIITVSGIVIAIGAHRSFTFHAWKIALLGMVASFNKAVSGGGYGPLMTSGQVLSGVEARAAVGITSFAEGFTCLAGVLLFLYHGQRLDLELLLPVACGALLSIPVSARIVRRVREDWMKRVIAAFTLIMGIFTLLKVAI